MVVSKQNRSLPGRRTLAALSLILLILMVSWGATAERQAGVGVVVATSGDVTVRRGGSPVPVSEGSVLREGDTLGVRLGATCRGFDPVTGNAFTLDGPAEMVFAASATGSVLDAVRAWVLRQFADWVGAGRSQPLLTRGLRTWETQSPTPQPLLPPNGGRSRPGRVHLRWSTIPGIQRYEVTIALSGGAESTRLASEGSLILTGLRPGEEYVWKVRPALASWPDISAWSTFRVLTEAEEAGLEQALQDLGNLEAGVLLLSAGLHEEAVLRFDTAVWGTEARAARRWRARAFFEIGLYKQAYEDLQSIGL